MAKRVRDALALFSDEERETLVTVFSAHSLPELIRTWGDPYETELAESAAAVATEAGLEEWQVAWQSAGETGEPWIGPDILEVLDELANRGVRAVLQVPIGFVSDHLEIFYDIDYEATERARDLGIEFRRTVLPNTDAEFVRILRHVATEAITNFAAPAAITT
jgi:ferrochelatase